MQRYLPEVRLGDKRIILVDGEPVRRHQPGAGGRATPASNMHVGGRAEKNRCSPRGKQRSAPPSARSLKDKGLIFVGIDVIGDYLTEINVTSPTGIQEIDRFDGVNLSALIWDAIEARRTDQAD